MLPYRVLKIETDMNLHRCLDVILFFSFLFHSSGSSDIRGVRGSVRSLLDRAKSGGSIRGKGAHRRMHDLSSILVKKKKKNTGGVFDVHGWDTHRG